MDTSEKETNENEIENADAEKGKQFEADKVIGHKLSTDSEFELDQEEKDIESLPGTPAQEDLDDGEEADSESDDSVREEEKPVKKKKKMFERSEKKEEKKKNNKRKNTPSYKRKKIRKILTDDKLQEETLKAIKDEEERQKRLEHQAQLAKEAKNVTDAAAFAMSEEATNFADLYDLDFEENLGVANYGDMTEEGLLSKSPVGELESLLSSDMSLPKIIERQLSNDNGRFLPSSSNIQQTAPVIPMPSPVLGTSSSMPGIATLDSIFRSAPPVDLPPTSGQQTVSSSGQVSTVGQTPLQTSAMSESNKSQINFMSPGDATSAPSSVPLSHFTASIHPSYFNMKPQQVAAPPYIKPARPSSNDVICISSESSDDELVRKPNVLPARTSETINISSGSDSSDDVIFAGTDDNEIVEDDPDVNNSGMHVDDSMNQPDANGRVLINRNRPPEEPEIFLSPHLAKAVKPHQIGGIRFMFDNIVESLEHYKKSSGFGCILAHSMGLGKTLQVITFIDLFLKHTGARTALCVVPVNTLLNWVTEFHFWIPDTVKKSTETDMKTGQFKLRLLSDIHKTTESRAHIISSWKQEGGVLLMGYEMFRLLTNQKVRRRQKRKQKSQLGDMIETIDLDEEDRMTEMTNGIYRNLVNPGPDLIVCDEGHRIKNSQASISQALKQIATRRRIVLTGYPLQNNLLEYWCMVDFVRPNFLGTKQEFSNMFERPIQNGQCADSNTADMRLMRYRSHVLHSLLKGFVQRRSHIVLKSSLPPKEEYVLMVRLSPWQKKLYNNFIKKQVKNSSGSWCSVLNPIKAFSICCKIWNHPDVLYRTVVRKTMEENYINGIDMDLDLPDAVMDVLNKSRKKKKDFSNILLSDITSKADTTTLESTSMTSDGKIVQSVGLNPFAEDREKGLNYDWAKELLHDYSPNNLELSGKMLILMQIIDHSVTSGDKILVFSQSLTTLTLIEEFLNEIDVPDPPGSQPCPRKWRKNESYYRLDGNTNTSEREKMINAFNAKDNDKVHLFLLSTRAGCLGINLVGANRVVVFDISWNPCHDAQAVCRVYRYGQTKKCVIYRLICDQTMEKKIYDRQISKQGMADRVVDELNPIQSMDRQDITKLLIYEDEDPPQIELDGCEQCSDDTLMNAVKTHGKWLTKKPFHHESLLMDCKNQRLTKAEKRAAERGYEQEKRASSSCNYSRPSYTNFYSASKQSTTGKSNPNLFQNNPSANRPIANVRPVQSTPYPMRPGPNMLLPPSAQGGLLDPQTISQLQRAGINVRRIIATADIPLPIANQSTSAPAKPLVAAGEAFYMIHGRKGMYIGTSSGRIFALRSQKQDARTAASPPVRTATGQMMTSREEESQIIKSLFSSLIHSSAPMHQQPIGNKYFPQQPMEPRQRFPMHNLQNPLLPQGYPMNQQMLTQQNNLMNGQVNPMMMQQNSSMNMMTQPNQMMTLQNQMAAPMQNILPQSEPIGQSNTDDLIEQRKFDGILSTMQKSNCSLESNENEQQNAEKKEMAEQNISPNSLQNVMIQQNSSWDQIQNMQSQQNPGMSQQNSGMSQQNPGMSQPNLAPNQLQNMMSQQNGRMTHQTNSLPDLSYAMPQNYPGMQVKDFVTQQNNTMMRQNSMMSQHSSYPSLTSLMTNEVAPQPPLQRSESVNIFPPYSTVQDQIPPTNNSIMKNCSVQSLDGPPLTSSVDTAKQIDQSADYSTPSNPYLLDMNQTTPVSEQDPPISIPSTNGNDLNYDLGFSTVDWPVT